MDVQSNYVIERKPFTHCFIVCKPALINFLDALDDAKSINAVDSLRLGAFRDYTWF